MNITLGSVDLELDDDNSLGQHFTAFQAREQLKAKPVVGSRESVLDSNEYYYESYETGKSQNLDFSDIQKKTQNNVEK